MATETVGTPGIAEGTTVGAYPASRWREDQLPPSGAPLGAATNTQTVASQRVTFTALTAGVDYFATDSSGSRYYRFTCDADVPGGDVAIEALLGVPQLRLAVGSGITAAGVSGTTYLMHTAGLADIVAAGGIGAAAVRSMHTFRLIATELAITGMVTKLRVQADIEAGTAPGTVTITVGLYPISITAASLVLGTVVPGSTVAFVNPVASTVATANSGDFALPADGLYLLGYTLSASLANNASLQGRVLSRYTG